jgi:uncharacterized membrane protein (UPF0182 family)
MSLSDPHIVRFGQTSYWAATASPALPESIAQPDRWFQEHMIYTHSDTGVKMLEVNTGNFVDSTQFFKQNRIYYGESGESGIFTKSWSAFPADRRESSEFDGYLYNGTGGVNISPPLSWMFDPNFITHDPTESMHVMRYKDIHDRMQFLYPYFTYEFSFGGPANNPQFKKIEVSPVTDGNNTYWLMPLVIALDSSHVPWSSATPFSFILNLVGFALIDAYNGNVQVFVTGNDYFSQIFLEEYKGIGATRELPEWLQNQVTYPKEMFMWKISKFNLFHMTDPKTFVQTKEVYTVPVGTPNEELSPSYIIGQPPGFKQPEFVGMQYLQLKDSASRDLVGYIVVQNKLESLGKMTFYSVTSNSSAKLIGPESARTIFVSDSKYNQLNQELKSSGNATGPVVAGNILYKVGDYEIYFTPVMVTNAEKIGIVGAVGAISTNGTSYTGLGNTAEEAFVSYLQKLSGAPAGNGSAITTNHIANETLAKIQMLERVFNQTGLTVVKPTAINAPLAFKETQANYTTDSDFTQAEAAIKEFTKRFPTYHGRVFEWQEESSVNFGILVNMDDVIENHYISIEVGNNQIGSPSS